ncbi:MAG: ligase-associated DNA damage response endonuclease PdeM [Candidatus Melainabacteria bacterium]|jgi:DNA ligase-associated metallophosphoesterase|nr:ligase-associated DNA damage response endonuclease PdeM [Candidatus Melainabacteria bacterium]
MMETKISGCVEFALQGENFLLLPQRGMFWPARKTLLVADVHLGKAAAFRAHSIAVPAGTTEKDLQTLSEMIMKCGAENLIFLGDLVHNKRGLTDRVCALILAWRERHDSVHMTLVRGNHDKKVSNITNSMRLDIVEEAHILGPFALKHHPKPEKAHYVLCGHTHPAVRLSGRGQKGLRLPCFSFGDKVGILPAFGSFTGCAEIEPEENEKIFVIADDEVIAVE